MIPGLAGFFAGGVQPIVLLDSWTNVSTDIDTPGSKSVSSGSNRMLFVRTSYRIDPGVDITAVTYGGESLTLVEEENSTGGVDLHTALWRLNEAGIAAASGTSFGLTPSTGGPEFRMHAASYENVDQSSPIVDNFSSVSVNAGDDPVASALTTVAGGIALGLIGINQGTSTIEPDPDASFSNMTERLEIAAANSHHLVGEADTDGSNFTATLSTSHLSRAHLIGVSLRPA